MPIRIVLLGQRDRRGEGEAERAVIRDRGDRSTCVPGWKPALAQGEFDPSGCSAAAVR